MLLNESGLYIHKYSVHSLQGSDYVLLKNVGVFQLMLIPSFKKYAICAHKLRRLCVEVIIWPIQIFERVRVIKWGMSQCLTHDDLLQFPNDGVKQIVFTTVPARAVEAGN